MALAVQAESPPLREDAAGAWRIGESQVLLELVIRAFQDGATPESIVQRYPTVTLADVYSVLAYYLRHPAEIEIYLARRERESAGVRDRAMQSSSDLSEIRARILARRPG